MNRINSSHITSRRSIFLSSNQNLLEIWEKKILAGNFFRKVYNESLKSESFYYYFFLFIVLYFVIEQTELIHFD